jgi:hypothetical protein
MSRIYGFRLGCTRTTNAFRQTKLFNFTQSPVKRSFVAVQHMREFLTSWREQIDTDRIICQWICQWRPYRRGSLAEMQRIDWW